MIGAAAAYMSGLFFASSFTGGIGLLILASAVLAVAAVGRKNGFRRVDYVIMAVCFTAAFAVSSAYTMLRYRPVAALDGTTGSFTGRVTDITEYEREYAAYILTGCTDSGVRVNVTYYGSNIGAEYGDTVSIGQCRFALPESDFLFDSERYYKSQGVFLSLNGVKDVSIVHNGSRRIKNALASYRKHIIEDFRAVLGDDCGSFLAGMTFGEKQGLDYNIQTALYRSGIGHVLAVSGLHISIAASVLMFLLSRLRMNRFVSFGLMNLFMILLVITANVPVSAVRAAVMIDFLYSAPLFRRQNDTLNSLAAAALLICITDPYAVYSTGFMMSLSGTFGIGVFAPWFTRNISTKLHSGKCISAMIAALCTTLSVFPLSMYFFDETSVISPAVNVLLVPLCAAAMLLGMMYTLTGGIFSFLLLPAGTAIRIVMTVSERIAHIGPFHAGGGGITSVLLITAGALTLFVFLFTHSRRAVAYSAAVSMTVFALFSLGSAFLLHRQLRIAVLGRDTDAAVVVSCCGRTDIIDLSGDRRSSRYVRKYLALNGCDKVESVLLTEKQESQYAAFLESLQFFPAERWIMTDEDEITLDMGTYTISCSGGRAVIKSEDSCLTILKAGSSAPEKGMAVYYGNVGRNTAVYDDDMSIYLDECDCRMSGMNNIELAASGSRYRIRRL